MPALLDTHHHLDFLPDEARPPFLEAVDDDVWLVAQTLTPSSFVELVSQAAAWAPRPDVIPLFSLGLHPWSITSPSQADDELAVFEKAVERTRFIGEIGLDLSPRRVDEVPADLQRHVLREILRLVGRAADGSCADEPHVLSIHAVRSAGEVIGLFEELGLLRRNVVPVFHRFSGTSDELTTLIRLGGYISVQSQMLATKRGRAYVRQVPMDRLLLETDLPAARIDAALPAGAIAAGVAREVTNCLRETVRVLTELRGVELIPSLERSQARLYGV